MGGQEVTYKNDGVTQGEGWAGVSTRWIHGACEPPWALPRMVVGMGLGVAVLVGSAWHALWMCKVGWTPQAHQGAYAPQNLQKVGLRQAIQPRGSEHLAPCCPLAKHHPIAQLSKTFL